MGAAPPFGTMYGHRVFVEQCFVGEPEMVFNAGTHTESLCMHYSDFAEMVKPVVGAFGLRPGGRRNYSRVLTFVLNRASVYFFNSSSITLLKLPNGCAPAMTRPLMKKKGVPLMPTPAPSL